MRLNSTKGFTLLEVSVVLAVTVVTSVMSYLSYNYYQGFKIRQTVKNHLVSIEQAQLVYLKQNPGFSLLDPNASVEIQNIVTQIEGNDPVFQKAPDLSAWTFSLTTRPAIATTSDNGGVQSISLSSDFAVKRPTTVQSPNSRKYNDFSP